MATGTTSLIKEDIVNEYFGMVKYVSMPCPKSAARTKIYWKDERELV